MSSRLSFRVRVRAIYYCYSATSAPPTASSSTPSSSSSSSSSTPIVPLAPSLNVGPNVSPPLALTLITGVSDVAFLSHHVTITFSPSAAISTSSDCTSVVLLKLTLSANVAPPSVDALNITSSLLFAVLLVNHAT